MKKKLTMLIALIALIFPVVAGCNKNVDEYSVEVELIKGESEEKNFSISDCARVKGAGKYESGKDVTVQIELANGCSIVDGSFVNETDGGTSLTLDRNNSYKFKMPGNDVKFQAQISVSDSAALNRNDVRFFGIYSNDGTGSSLSPITTDYTKIRFPSYSEVGATSMVSDPDKLTPTISKNSMQTLEDVIIDNFIINKNRVDLNYLYNDSEHIDPNKLTWRVAPLTKSGVDSCGTYQDANLTDPVSQSICVIAVMVNNAQNKLIETAKSKIMTSELFVAKGDKTCNLSTGVSEDCYYVSYADSLKGSTQLDGTHVRSYYGYIDEGDGDRNIEALTSNNNYITCANSMKDISECQTPLRVAMLDDQLDKLQINSFIKDMDKTISVASNDWIYSVALHDVVPAKITVKGATGQPDTTYSFTYIGDGINLMRYAPGEGGLKFVNTPNSTNGTMYSIDLGESPNTCLKDYFGSLNHAVVSSTTETESIASIRNRIYAVADNCSEEEKREIRNSYYTISLNGHNLTIQKNSIGELYSEVENGDKLIELTVGTSTRICHIDDRDCFNEVVKTNFENDYDNFINFVTEGKNLENLGLLDVYYDSNNKTIKYILPRSEKTITYEFDFDNNSIKIILDSVTTNINVLETTIKDDFTYSKIETSLIGDNLNGKQELVVDGRISQLVFDTNSQIPVEDNKFELEVDGKTYICTIDGDEVKCIEKVNTIEIGDETYVCLIESGQSQPTCQIYTENPLTGSPFDIVENKVTIEGVEYTIEYENSINTYIKEGENYVPLTISIDTSAIEGVNDIIENSRKLVSSNHDDIITLDYTNGDVHRYYQLDKTPNGWSLKVLNSDNTTQEYNIYA